MARAAASSSLRAASCSGKSAGACQKIILEINEE